MIVGAVSSARLSARMKLQRWQQHIISHTPYRTHTYTYTYSNMMALHTKLFIFKIVKFVHVKIEVSLLFAPDAIAAVVVR